MFGLKTLFLDLGLLAQRLLFGGMMFAFHGSGKLGDLVNGKISWTESRIGLPAEVEFALVALAEGVASLLVMLGLGTRWVAIPLVIAMLVAGFVAHADDPIPAGRIGGLNAVEHLNDEGRAVVAQQAEHNPVAAQVHEGVQQAQAATTEEERKAAIAQTRLPGRTGTGELAFLFLAGFLGLALMGGGRFSLDRLAWPALRRFLAKRKQAKRGK